MGAVILLLAFMATLTALTLWFWQNSTTRQLIDKIPGPPAWPIIGNAIKLRPAGSDFYALIVRICKQFGAESGVIRIWLGPHPMLAVTKADTVEVLLQTTKHMSKSRVYAALYPWLGTGLLTSWGEKWKTRRRLLTPTFHFKILTDFMDVFNEQCNIMVQKLEAKVDQGRFDMFPYITLCALDIICETAMGQTVNAQEKQESEYVKAVYKIGEVIQHRMKSPWLHPSVIFDNTPSGKEHNHCVQVLQGFTRKIIQERNSELERSLQSSSGKVTMEDINSGKPFLIGKQKRLAFLDMLLVTAKSGADLSLDGIQEEVDTFMFEGHDTTAAAGNWAVYLIGSHPEVQKRLHDELDAVLGRDDRPITTDDLKDLQYLDRCIKEALRLFPSVPMFARVIEEECQIGGYTVPKGASCTIVTSVLHRDPEHFPDPERFDPDRWDPETSSNRHPYCYVPFSAGMRNCIGQKFAQMEEKVVLASIFRRFHVTTYQTREELHPVGELIMRPRDGITVSLKRRD